MPMYNLVAIDLMDQKILASLAANARVPYAVVAQEVGLSAPSVHARLKKLESTGVVRGYRVDVAREPLGYCLFAIVAVQPAPRHDWAAAVAAFQALPEVEACYRVTGSAGYVLKVCVRDTADLERLLQEINALDWVGSTCTTVVLSTLFER